MLARRPMIWLAPLFLSGVMLRRWTFDLWPTAESHRPLLGLLLLALAAGAGFLLFRPIRGPRLSSRATPAAPTPESPETPGKRRRIFPPLRPPSFVGASPLAAYPAAWWGRRPMLALLLLGVLALAGGVWRQDDARRRGADRFAGWPHYAVATGRVSLTPDAAITHESPDFWRAIVTVETLNAEAPPRGTATVELRGRGPVRFQRGDRLVFRYFKSPPEVPACPGAFDGARWLETRGLAGAMRLVGAPIVRPDPRPGPWIDARRRLDEVRRYAIRRTLDSFPAGDAQLLAAVLYGYRAELGDDIRLTFRRVGIAHVLAISGLHVGLVVGLLWWTLAGVLPGRRARSLACIGAAVMYLAISGADVAACRATIMTAMALGGYVIRRRGDAINGLGASALLLLAVNPASAVDLGFQLSFLAVFFISRGLWELSALRAWWRLRRRLSGARDDDAEDDLRGILTGGERPSGAMRSVWGRRDGWAACWGRRFGDLAGLNLTAWIGNAPLVLYAFGQVSPVGLLVNFAAIPLMSFVLAGGMLLPFTWLLPESWSAWVVLALLAPSRALLLLAALTDRIPGGSFETAFPDWGWVFGFYLASGAWLARRVFAGAWRRGLGAGGAVGTVLCAVGLVLASGSRGAPEQGRVTLLPGARGGVMVLEAPDGVVAALGSADRRAAWTLTAYLKSTGRLRLDHYTALVDRLPSVRPAAIAATEAPDDSTGDSTGDWRGLLELFALSPALRVTPLARRGVGDFPAAEYRPWVPGLPFEGFFGRERGGVLVWWSVRPLSPAEPALTLTVADGLWPAQLSYRQRYAVPGTKAALADLRVRGRPTRALSEGMPDSWLFWRGGPGDAAGWRREDWGALRLTGRPDGRVEASAYDGRAWRILPPPDAP